MTLRGLSYQAQVPVPVTYKGIRLGCGFRADLIVEHELLVELKSVAQILPVHHAQTLTYLKLLGLREALLINFNVPVLKDGIRRLLA